MTTEQCTPGVKVWYAPSPGHWFRGVVAEYPWQLGSGIWVTKLKDMEPGYQEFTKKSINKVYAAALSRLRLGDEL